LGTYYKCMYEQLLIAVYTYMGRVSIGNNA
jgi:hypothetical protein